jgi:ABC-type multidrug transport system fused ATPase/permease subunit
MRYWSYTLHSFLINLFGVVLLTGLHVWDFAIWLVAPLFFYWVAMFLSTVRIRRRSAAKSAMIMLSLLVGHLLQLGFAFLVTGVFGQWLSRLIPGGVEMLELFFTNSMNSVAMGSLIAAIGSFLLVQFYFSRAKSRDPRKGPVEIEG